MKILVLGVTGMLGNTVYRWLSRDERYDAWGTARSSVANTGLSSKEVGKIILGTDVLDADGLVDALNEVKPDAVINCIGLIKQQKNASSPLVALPINAMLPHRLSALCDLHGARLVHISTDCVFSGKKGLYEESDLSDAMDLYGKSKYMGELHQEPHAITLRTSIIGHELNSNLSLVDWFLSKEGSVKGFSKAVFSGLPTVELARVIGDYVLPNKKLSGLYHVSSDPVDKLCLLNIISDVYQKNITIVPDESLVIDRSLNSDRFREATGYMPAPWGALVKQMHDFHNSLDFKINGPQ